ncbi:Polyphosphoinositide phosphatase [Pseudocercospora fuligena]|uniref:Polyphosphoinositide phosphatase n=1 Tax=Pseudocercospora fuligena TaxID=685502 RepID=A0A8H6RKU3_9PEZI|nr:Polyphosphoinositide phosphatase [Pseudocercospora fuligena]
MDQGPVDAGPNDSDYGSRPRSYSPEQDRGSSRARAGFRSDSMRRQASRNDTDSTDDEKRLRYVKSGNPHRRGSSESAKSLADPPLYPRVGATAREVSGEVCIDGDDHMKEDGSAQVKDELSRPHRMHKFILYETNSRYWITGSDITEKYSRLLRIDRNSPPGQIALFEDETVYDRKERNDVLQTILEGNKSTGGLRQKFVFWGVLGFIRFTESYYMLLITKRKQVAMIGGHYVYQVEGTELVPLTTGSSNSFLRDRNPEEARFLGILNNLDLTKSFYYSYSYDITNSLQRNIMRQREAMNAGIAVAAHEYNGMFVWNHHLLKPAVEALKHPYDWCLPIIHGFLNQELLDIFGRSVYLTIIGRRSRFFAGARFLKRGVNDSGYVANDVETEQIVAEKLTTSFHAPGPTLFSNPTYTSYLHHRGSIPLYWIQDNSGVTPKPAIDIRLADPFYQPAALHFDHLFQRYGCPIYVLNLVKSREKTPRESKLLYAFKDCIDYLNQSLPEGKKIQYKAYDMARAAKTRNSDVIGGLEVIAKDILDQTGFFHNGDGNLQETKVQNGIARTNCIDCLDRTNAAQFVIGKHAFALQLKALGIIAKDSVDYDTDAVNLFTAMFHDHGDNIAMQYGGSHLVNTMATYRKLGHWQSSSRDMVESFKRYYHNSFLDSQRQEAYNLFLGNYIWAAGQPMLWDLTTDYYLHHSDPKAWLERNRRNYIEWYTPEYLEPRKVPPRIYNKRVATELENQGVAAFDDYWRETYPPSRISSLDKTYASKLLETYNDHFIPDKTNYQSKSDFSPFVRRVNPNRHADSPEKRPPRKGVKIVDPSEESTEKSSQLSESVPRPPTANMEELPSILRETVYKDIPAPTKPQATPTSDTFRPADKAQMHLWTLNQFHIQSLNPHVSNEEASEYARYISHPTNIPLVTSTDLPSDANIDYVEYVSRAGGNAFEDFDDEETFGQGVSEEDLAHYWDYLEGKQDPLTVTDEDLPKKRYKAYRQWLKGKSLFKQSKVDPEYKPEGTTMREST